MSHRHPSWASITYVEALDDDRTVLVKDPSKLPAYWKLPGGKSEETDSDPEETALRELFEETGLTGKVTELLYKQDRCNHMIYLYRIIVPSYEGLLKVGDEGEAVALFEKQEFLRGMPDFFPSHMGLVKSAGIIQ